MLLIIKVFLLEIQDSGTKKNSSSALDEMSREIQKNSLVIRKTVY